MNPRCVLPLLLAAGIAAAENPKPLEPARTANERWQIEELKRQESSLQDKLSKTREAINAFSRRDAVGQREKVVNGVLTTLLPAAGGLLFSESGKFSTQCSGTLIGCDSFLTAAHCVENPDLGRYQVYFQHAGLFGVERIDRHSSPSGSADLAVIRLKGTVTGIAPIVLQGAAELPVGSASTIAGFGRSGGDHYDYGLKRMGVVTTSACQAPYANGSFICWDFDNPFGVPGSNSNTCNADSGGGLYAGSPAAVAGVTKGGRNPACLPSDHSYDTSVFHYASWIRAKAGLDSAPAGVCGSVPILGTAGTRETAGSSTLDVAHPERLFALSVPPNTARLRVALNGIDDPGEAANFDVLANPGTIGPEGSNACESKSPGQYEFCQIVNPTAGSWQIAVRRRAGQGLFQVVATTIARGN